MNTTKHTTIWEPIDFTIYLKFIKWPVLLSLILEFIFRWWGGSIGSGLLFDQLEIITWIIRLSALGFIAYQSVKYFGYSTAISAISGTLSGFIIGLSVSLFRFTDGIALWKFFNIITETITVAVVGSLIAIFITYASHIKK